MWAALVRQVAFFALTWRGKRVLIFVGIILLGFLTAVLIDLHLYLTASFAGALTAAVIIWRAFVYFPNRAKHRERDRQVAEEAIRRTAAVQARYERRTAAAQARGEKFDRAKSAVVGVARTATRSAADIAGLAKTGIAGASATVGSGAVDMAGLAKTGFSGAGDKFDRAKSTATVAAKAAGASTVDAASRAKAGISGARDRFDTWRAKPKAE